MSDEVEAREPRARGSEDKAGEELLRHCLSNYPAGIAWLADNGVNPNAVDAQGRTMLHLAAMEGRADAIDALLRHGAGVDAVDQEGWTPLHHAAERGDTGLVKLLLEHGAAVDAADWKGRTALHVASLKGEAEPVEQLIDGGAQVSLTDHGERTAEDIARGIGHHAVAEILHRAAEKAQHAGASTGRRR